MVLGKLPVPGRRTIWITVGHLLKGRVGLFGHFTLICSFSSLSPSL